MKYLKHFANAQEAATILATWPFNTVSSIQGQPGASINIGVNPQPVGYDHYICTINAETTRQYKILGGGPSGSWGWYPDRVIIDGTELSELSDMIELSAGLHTVEIYDNPENSGYYNLLELEGYFDECHYTSIIIPNYVTSIGTLYDGINYAGLYGCLITSVTIPNSVIAIGNGAFKNCENLLSVVIPSSVTTIGRIAFEDCFNITSITVETTTPPTLGNNAFYNTNDCPIYVPAASVDAYKAATGWSEYASRIQAIQ